MSGSGAEADLAPSRRSRRLLPPVPGGPHGDRGTPFAVAGDFGQAEPPAGRLGAAVDRQHAGNQVLARAPCCLQERPDDPAADAGALMAGVDPDARPGDLAGTAAGIHHAGAGLPGGDDLLPVRAEARS